MLDKPKQSFLNKVVQRTLAFWIGFTCGAIIACLLMGVALFWIGTMFIKRLIG